MKMELQAIRKWAVQTARLCCGVPDYDVYVKHLREHHPDRAVPSYKEFFRSGKLPATREPADAAARPVAATEGRALPGAAFLASERDWASGALPFMIAP